MTNTIVAATLMAVCLLGCKYLGANKEAELTVLNVNDLNDQHKKDKEALRAKYDGKEVVVMGRATEDFDPNHVYFEIGDKQLTISLQADQSKETWVGVDCRWRRRIRISLPGFRGTTSSRSRAYSTSPKPAWKSLLAAGSCASSCEA